MLLVESHRPQRRSPRHLYFRFPPSQRTRPRVLYSQQPLELHVLGRRHVQRQTLRGYVELPDLYVRRVNFHLISCTFDFDSRYTGATLEEVSSAYGVQIHGRIESPNYYSVYQKVRPGTSLLSRDAFLRVATGCFLRTVLPAPYVEYVFIGGHRLCLWACSITKNPNFNVREVVNVHSFFRALEWWKGLG